MLTETQSEAIRLSRAGLRNAEIAARLGRRPGTIAAALSRARASGADVPLGRPGPVPGVPSRRRTQAEARENEILGLAHAGLQAREIGAWMGCSSASVSELLSRLRRAGVEVPMGRRGPAGQKCS